MKIDEPSLDESKELGEIEDGKDENTSLNKAIIKSKMPKEVGNLIEFIKPIVINDGNGKPLTTIQEGDVIICYNYRTDRCREITLALSQKDFHEQNMHKLNLYYVTLTNYDESYKNVKVVYNKDNITQTLGEVLEKAGKKQIRIAETEKYPHVTFFFSGGRENEFDGEKRIMVNSPKVSFSPDLLVPAIIVSD